MKKLILVILILTANFISIAGGFQINALSQKSASMGGSITGLALDGSSSFFNPGAISFLDSNQINLGFNVIVPQTIYLGPYRGSEKMKSQPQIPYQIYAAFKLKRKWSAGLSINQPFGFSSKWDNNWSGRYVTQESKVKSLYIQPTISYRLNDHFSFGAAPVLALGSYNARKALPYETLANGEASLELKGNANSIGFNAGLMAVFGKISLGLDYRSPIKLEIKDADATFNNVPTSLIMNNSLPSSTKFNTTINLPSVISLGIGYTINEKALINIDFNLTGWSVYKTVDYEFPDYQALNSSSKKNYKSSLAFRAGGQYKFTSKFALRAGIAYDQSPVKDGYLNPDFPDANKFDVAAGFTYRIKRHLYFETSLMFEDINERKETSGSTDSFYGTYKSNSYSIGLGLQYNF